MGQPASNSVRVLGIPFFRGDVRAAVDKTLKGGLLTVPAAPALVNLGSDSAYRDALLASDVVIPDSGYMVLIWNTLHWYNRLEKISGLAFLWELFSREFVKSNYKVFLVCPSTDEAERNRNFLSGIGIDVDSDRSYVAPRYSSDSKIEDETLVALIETTAPDMVLVNIGGGVQEKLGHFLKRRLSQRPAIVCTGAAIAFLTGAQARIPPLADRFYLGWLWRCASHPALYVPRYLGAIRLAVDIVRFGSGPTHPSDAAANGG